MLGVRDGGGTAGALIGTLTMRHPPQVCSALRCAGLGCTGLWAPCPPPD